MPATRQSGTITIMFREMKLPNFCHASMCQSFLQHAQPSLSRLHACVATMAQSVQAEERQKGSIGPQGVSPGKVPKPIPVAFVMMKHGSMWPGPEQRAFVSGSCKGFSIRFPCCAVWQAFQMLHTCTKSSVTMNVCRASCTRRPAHAWKSRCSRGALSLWPAAPESSPF